MIHLGTIAGHLQTLSHLSYSEIFLAILASGHVIPVPESVTLALLGYLNSLGHFNLWLILLVGVLATTTFDLIMFGLSLGGSELAVKFSTKIKAVHLDRYTNAEAKHLFGLVFASHFVPGWRFANPIIAGLTQMPWQRFSLYSLISNLVYAPLYILLGFLLSNRITRVLTYVSSLQHIFLIAFIVIIGTLLVVYNMRHAEK